jgi:hypothetical protein
MRPECATSDDYGIRLLNRQGVFVLVKGVNLLDAHERRRANHVTACQINIRGSEDALLGF